ncbi:hypothetical protein DFP72DRAFT_839575 [Ephemerocybe angulata]|uniref:Uncharacterized protein n=1 Tax=Ephemerocybe angulata TaxID=980116 RepID=A0A8H6IJY1_9AGAR|nr:hypothetical protein DFP72DRAFT_839575 [Tulosesus angulatus]
MPNIEDSEIMAMAKQTIEEITKKFPQEDMDSIAGHIYERMCGLEGERSNFQLKVDLRKREGKSVMAKTLQAIEKRDLGILACKKAMELVKGGRDPAMRSSSLSPPPEDLEDGGAENNDTVLDPNSRPPSDPPIPKQVVNPAMETVTQPVEHLEPNSRPPNDPPIPKQVVNRAMETVTQPVERLEPNSRPPNDPPIPKQVVNRAMETVTQPVERLEPNSRPPNDPPIPKQVVNAAMETVTQPVERLEPNPQPPNDPPIPKQVDNAAMETVTQPVEHSLDPNSQAPGNPPIPEQVVDSPSNGAPEGERGVGSQPAMETVTQPVEHSLDPYSQATGNPPIPEQVGDSPSNGAPEGERGVGSQPAMETVTQPVERLDPNSPNSNATDDQPSSQPPNHSPHSQPINRLVSAGPATVNDSQLEHEDFMEKRKFLLSQVDDRLVRKANVPLTAEELKKKREDYLLELGVSMNKQFEAYKERKEQHLLNGGPEDENAGDMKREDGREDAGDVGRRGSAIEDEDELEDSEDAGGQGSAIVEDEDGPEDTGAGGRASAIANDVSDDEREEEHLFGPLNVSEDEDDDDQDLPNITNYVRMHSFHGESDEESDSGSDSEYKIKITAHRKDVNFDNKDVDMNLIREEKPVKPSGDSKSKREEEAREAELAGYCPSVVHNFIVARTPVPLPYRRWARVQQHFLPEAALISLDFALQFLLVSPTKQYPEWTTRCHYHTTLDQTATVNDLDNAERQANIKPPTKPGKKCPSFKGNLVTGVPYRRSGESTVPEEVLKVTPKSRKGTVLMARGSSTDVAVLPPSPTHLDSSKWLEFFLKDPDGRYICHCGCILEEVLLDFYLWKAAHPLYSVSTGTSEPLGNPVDPRTRAHYHKVLTSFGINVRSLYKYDDDGQLQVPVVGSYWYTVPDEGDDDRFDDDDDDGERRRRSSEPEDETHDDGSGGEEYVERKKRRRSSHDRDEDYGDQTKSSHHDERRGNKHRQPKRRRTSSDHEERSYHDDRRGNKRRDRKRGRSSAHEDGSYYDDSGSDEYQEDRRGGSPGQDRDIKEGGHREVRPRAARMVATEVGTHEAKNRDPTGSERAMGGMIRDKPKGASKHGGGGPKKSKLAVMSKTKKDASRLAILRRVRQAPAGGRRPIPNVQRQGSISSSKAKEGDPDVQDDKRLEPHGDIAASSTGTSGPNYFLSELIYMVYILKFYGVLRPTYLPVATVNFGKHTDNRRRPSRRFLFWDLSSLLPSNLSYPSTSSMSALIMDSSAETKRPFVYDWPSDVVATIIFWTRDLFHEVAEGAADRLHVLPPRPYLMRVNRQWHNVMVSRCTFFTTVVAIVEYVDYGRIMNAGAVGYALTHSGACSLDIIFLATFSRNPADERWKGRGVEWKDSVRWLMSTGTMDRCKTFSFTMPGYPGKDVFTSPERIETYPQLEEVRINGYDGLYHPIPGVLQGPNLKRLYVAGFKKIFDATLPTARRIEWANLHTLNLHDARYTPFEIHALLSATTSLIDLKIACNDSLQEEPRPLVHNALRSLTISYNYERRDVAGMFVAFELLSFPSLSTLNLCVVQLWWYSEAPGFRYQVPAIIRNHPSITSLSLSGVAYESSSLVDTLRLTPHVKSLVLGVFATADDDWRPVAFEGGELLDMADPSVCPALAEVTLFCAKLSFRQLSAFLLGRGALRRIHLDDWIGNNTDFEALVAAESELGAEIVVKRNEKQRLYDDLPSDGWGCAGTFGI